jgi:hypothetical protein
LKKKKAPLLTHISSPLPSTLLQLPLPSHHRTFPLLRSPCSKLQQFHAFKFYQTEIPPVLLFPPIPAPIPGISPYRIPAISGKTEECTTNPWHDNKVWRFGASIPSPSKSLQLIHTQIPKRRRRKWRNQISTGPAKKRKGEGRVKGEGRMMKRKEKEGRCKATLINFLFIVDKSMGSLMVS